jgi:flagellar motor switch protein FliN/FliY
MEGNMMLETRAAQPVVGDVPATLMQQDLSLISHVQVSLTAQIGTLSLSVEKLFGLTRGDVLEMNELLDEPVTLLLDGKPVARGELLGVDEHFGIRILEIS